MSNPDFTSARRAMLDSQLRTSGVSEPSVIAAMAACARENFVPAAMCSIAYMDRSIDIGGNRKLNPPVATAMMLQAAEAKSSDRVLLIGAGTGYMAALLAATSASIIAVEEDDALYNEAASRLSSLATVTLVKGPLIGGWANLGPYSLIIIDGAIAELPVALSDQLTDGGRIVCGLIDNNVSRLAIGYRAGGELGNALALRPFADTDIAVLSGFARKAEFVF
jgi:protein-L-isoaspartate(D-aspartate) O-methyltransferase